MNYITSDKIAQLKQAADVIFEIEGKTILGFCKSGTTTTAQAAWSILEIRESNPGALPNNTTFMWAKGQCSFDLIFDNYENYEYTFKKF
jgi:hypothetical protein